MRQIWPRLCLMVVFAGLTGIILYVASEYFYPHGGLVGTGAKPVYEEDLRGLDIPGWVRFYRQNEFFVVVSPLVLLGLGVVGWLIQKMVIQMLQIWYRKCKSAGRAMVSMTSTIWFRNVTNGGRLGVVSPIQIDLRQLTIVAVVAFVFGVGGGWLGGNLAGDGQQTTQIKPAGNRYALFLEQQRQGVLDRLIDREISCMQFPHDYCD